MSSSTPSRGRIRVLFTGVRSNPSWEPWGRDVLDALSRSHDVTLVDPDRPLAEQVADPRIEAVVDSYSLVNPEVAAAAAGHVRLWQLGAVGYDHTDVPSLARNGVPTANCPGFTSSRSLAEAALMLAMMVMRSYNGLVTTVEAGRIGSPSGRQLASKSLLIIGFGASGRELARRSAAFGMRTMAINHRGRVPALERRYGLAWMGGLEDLDRGLAEADVVSLHIPLTRETRHILDARRLALMKPGAVVVNVSRGGLIDDEALARAVRGGHLFGAGLDVVAGEPSGSDHPLRGIPQVILLPHIAGATDATAQRRARFAALNISRLRYGLEPLSRVDNLPPQG